MNDILFWLVAALGLCVWFLARRHGSGPLAWRWFSGHALDGQYRTNATWLHPATKVLHETGHAVRWHHLPRLQRAGIRTGLVLVTLGLVALRHQIIWTAGSITAGLVLTLSWMTWRLARTFRHHRMYVAPLHRALGPQVGISPRTRPSSWLKIEPGTRAAAITLPSDFSGHSRHKDMVVSTAMAKLGLETPAVRWELEGPRPVVRLVSAPSPPEWVRLADIEAVIETSRDTDLVLGLGRGKSPVSVSLDDDSPHLALSQGSGSGKSTTGRTIGSQMLHKGCVLLVWDFKRISQNWCKGLPNVVYCRTAEEIHLSALWLLGEIERRNEVAEAGSDLEGNVQASVGPRIIVLAEELNATMNRLRAYWRQVRRSSDTERSPAVEAIEDALFMGRQVRVNIVAVAQKMSARASASGDARENMGVRILGRYTASAWKMLVPEVQPMPPSSNHRGRVQVVTGGVARETQMARLTAAEARRLAMSGTVSRWPASVSVTPVPLSLDSGPDQQVVTETVTPELPEPERIRISDAVALGVLTMSLTAARKASHRPGFPQPSGWQGIARLYDIEALDQFEQSRRK